MRQLIIFIATIFLGISASFAQMKKIENTALFVKQMEQSISSVKSIESDFKQIKHIEGFNKDITSSGKFYYMASDKISLNYVKPLPYLTVINGNKVKIESNGKKNVINLKDNLKDNKQMQEMHSMLTVCMTGKFSSISNDNHLEFYDGGQFYLITIKPVNESANKYVTQFDILLNKNDMSVDKLRVSEIKGDYTEYYFSNKKFNTLNNDALFKI